MLTVDFTLCLAGRHPRWVRRFGRRAVPCLCGAAPQPSTSRVTLGGLPSQVASEESIGLSQELDLKKSDGEEERPVCRSEPRLGLGWNLAS